MFARGLRPRTPSPSGSLALARPADGLAEARPVGGRPLTLARVRPNLVLVVFDTARADAFEPYGAPAGSSPAVAQLAASGVAHQHTYSTASWTAPSHGSMFSGQLPRSAGMGHVGGTTPKAMQAAMGENAGVLLPNVLRAAGYATLGVSTNLWVSPRQRVRHGVRRVPLPHRRAQPRPPPHRPQGPRSVGPRCAASARGRRRRGRRRGTARVALDPAGTAVLPVRQPDRVPLPVPAAETVDEAPAVGPRAHRASRRSVT